MTTFEFTICKGTSTSSARLNADSVHDLLNEIKTQNNKNDFIYYAGGNDFTFNCELFEVYGI